MAAGIEQGTIEIYILKSSGKRGTKLLSANTRLTSPQDNPDDPRLWMRVARRNARADGDVGSKLEVVFTSEAADILDSTDMLWVVPVTIFYADGSVIETTLGLDDFNAGDTNTTYQDENLATAKRAYTVGVTTANKGEKITLGHLVGEGKMWMDFYDDTA